MFKAGVREKSLYVYVDFCLWTDGIAFILVTVIIVIRKLSCSLRVVFKVIYTF